MHILVFLIDAVVSFFCTLFLLRFTMQATRVSFSGQFGDFVVKLTNWAVKPLRRVVPGLGEWTWPAWLQPLVCNFCWQRSWFVFPVHLLRRMAGLLRSWQCGLPCAPCCV